MRKLRQDHEAQEQRALVEWLELRRIPFFAVPNGAFFGYGSKWGRIAHARKLKAAGVRPGSPDIVLIRQWYDPELKCRRPVAIEMKSQAGKVSPAQMGMHATMREDGWVVLIFYSADAAIAELTTMGF